MARRALGPATLAVVAAVERESEHPLAAAVVRHAECSVLVVR